MAFVDLTKQLAKEALLSAAAKEPAPAQPPPAENVGSIILGQLGAMQKALKEDEELVVWFENGIEKIRVIDVIMPSWRLGRRWLLGGGREQRFLGQLLGEIDEGHLE